MPSLRARLTNLMLRLTTKSMWRPGLQISTVRRHAASMDARIGRRVFTLATEAVEMGGVPALWVGSPGLAAAKGTLLYLHGGAWSIHLPFTYRRFVGSLVAATDMRVLLVDYRLAPECVYPAATDDCLAVYRDLVQTTGRPPLAIAGDSAGGNLTLVTLMRARDEGLPLPTCAVLLSPATDLTLSGPSLRYNAEADPMFGTGAGDLLPGTYCPGADRAHPFISPLFGVWAGLPPLYFLAGSTEMLLDDSVRAHDRAVQAGNAASIDVWPDLPHVFPVFDWLPESRIALRAIASFIHRNLQSSERPEPVTVASTEADAGSATTAVDAVTAQRSAL